MENQERGEKKSKNSCERNWLQKVSSDQEVCFRSGVGTKYVLTPVKGQIQKKKSNFLNNSTIRNKNISSVSCLYFFHLLQNFGFLGTERPRKYSRTLK